MPEMMKAVVYEKMGRTGNLVLRDVERPVPADDQVLIKIRATAVNAADYRSIRLGSIPKRRIFGSDIAGQVVAAGKNCRRFAVGDEVLGDISEHGLGGFAEYVAVTEAPLAKKPSAVTFADAAALPMSAVTALQALRNLGKIQPGQRVLICGAGGGVGTFAVMLAKFFGADVTAVCSAANMPLMQALRADQIVNYQETPLNQISGHYDLVLAIHGSYPLKTYRRLLTQEGICVVVGGAISQIMQAVLFGRFYSLGRKKIHALQARPNTDDLDFVAWLVAEGTIRPVIDKTLPLAETADAVAYVSQGHARGKVIINI